MDSQVMFETDGRTVWVHLPEATIGRFGPNGIDVHTAAADGCLDCAHHETDMNSWLRFQRSMLEHHRVEVPDEFMPDRLR